MQLAEQAVITLHTPSHADPVVLARQVGRCTLQPWAVCRAGASGSAQ